MIECNNELANVQACSRERGMALLVVLWIIVAAALVVSAFNATVRSGVSFVGSEVQLARAEALLDAGAEIAATRLIDEDESRQWAPDGRPHTIAFAGSSIVIAVSDGNARIDLNKADPKLLMGLLRQFTTSETKAAALRDRILLARGDARGTPETTQERSGGNSDGAEREEQPQNEVPSFVDVAQLRGLEGMSVELYRAIAPFLTVYSSDGRINPLAAPDEVLMSIPEFSRGDVNRFRAAVRTLLETNAPPPDIVQRAEPYLAEKPGPAYIVTATVLQRDGRPGASSVYVLATGLDAKAPYRLIAKRPAAFGAPGGAS
jgi:general secretion pathway protein K